MADLTDIKGVGAALAFHLRALGITTVEGLAAAPIETILVARGISAAKAEALRDAARAHVATPDEATRASTPKEPKKAKKKKDGKKKKKKAKKRGKTAKGD